MSFLNWLGTQARGVAASANPFDGGANYNSVMRAEEERRKKKLAAQRIAEQNRKLAGSRGPVAPRPTLQVRPASNNSVQQTTRPQGATNIVQNTLGTAAAPKNLTLDRKSMDYAARAKQQEADYQEALEKRLAQSNTLERMLNSDNIEADARNAALRARAARVAEEAYRNGRLIDPAKAAEAQRFADTAYLRGLQTGADTELELKNLTSGNTLHNVATAGSRLLGEGLGNEMFGANQEGFQASDIGRFVANLPGGMASIATSAPSNISRAGTGKGVDRTTGEEVDLTTMQRVGSGLTTGVDAVGTLLGGSGTAIKAVLSSVGRKQLAQMGSSGIKQLLKKFGGDMGEEALEESAQYITELLSEEGNLDNFKFSEMASAAGQGAAGGGIFSGFGMAVSFPTEVQLRAHNDLLQKNQRYAQLNDTLNNSNDLHARAEASRSMKHIRRNATNAEGGFIAGPLAGDFSGAKARGEVFEGVDGKPRFEVDDSGAKLTDIGQAGFQRARLDQVIDHPELFKQYPEIANTSVTFKHALEGTNTAGQFDDAINEIALNPKLMGNAEKTRSTLLHELQHRIQKEEGFARGGSGKSSTDAQYKNQAGEAEARAVQARMDMPMSERYVRDEKLQTAELRGVNKTIKQLEAENRTTAPNIPSDKVFAHNVEQLKNAKQYDKFIENDGQLPTQSVPLDSIVPTQKTVSASNLKKTQNVTNSKENIILVKQDGRYYVADGHHRISNAILKGDRTINAKVVEQPRSTFDDSLDVPKQDLIIRNDSKKALSVEQIRNHPEMLELDSKFESLGREIAQLEQAGRSKNYSQIVQKKKSQDMIIKQQQEVANRLSKQGMMMSVDKEQSGYEKLDSQAKLEYGKPADKLTPTQLRNIIAREELTVKGGKDLIKKVGKPANGYTVDTSRDGLVYGGYNSGIYTDGYSLVADPEFAKTIYDTIHKKEEAKTVRGLLKDGKFTDRAEAEAFAAKDTADRIADTESRFPLEQINQWKEPGQHLSNTYGKDAEVSGVFSSGAVVTDGEIAAIADPDRLALFFKQYPNATLRVGDSGVSPIQVRDGNKVVGVVMPIKGDVKSELRAKPSVIDDTSSASPAPQAPKAEAPKSAPTQKTTTTKKSSTEITSKERVQRALDPNEKLQYKNLNAKERVMYREAKKNTIEQPAKVADKPAELQRKTQESEISQNQEASQAKTDETTSVQKTSQKGTAQVAKLQESQVRKLDRSYIDNTTNVEKKRGFTQSVKASDEVSVDTKKKVSGKYNVRSTDKMAIEAHNFAQGNLKDVTTDVNERLAKKTGTVTDQDIADAIAVAKRQDSLGNYDTSQQIYDQLAEHGTRGGQAIQAFSLLQNRTPEGVKFQMLRNLKKAGVKLTEAQQKEVSALIDKVRKTKPNTEARNRALFDTLDYVNRKIPSNFGDKIVNFWRAGLLTAPKTTGGNIVGNVSELAARELWANPVAVATDKFFSMITGKRTKVLSNGGAIAKGAKAGVARGVDYMKTGFDTRNIGSKYDAPRRINYDNKVVDAYVNGVYRWMGAQDQPFYYGAKAAAAYDLAKADGMNLGYKGDQLAQYVEKSTSDSDWKPQTFKTKQDATEYAKYAVYQNDTLLGRMAASVKNAADQKGLRWVTDFILPFTQVPSSIAVRVVDRTPIGTIREAVSQMKNKKFDQRAMAEAVGNGSFGVPVVLAGMALAQVGEITGDYPDEDKERKLWEAEGKQPYSVRIGDRWYSLNYMQPFGTILNVGRQVTDDINNGKSEAEAWMAATAAAVQSVSDQSFLKGLNGVMNAINDPERSAASFVRSTAGSIVPNFIRSFATATDGNKRVVDSPFDAVVNSVPGARQTLPKKQDMFGEDQVANDTPINQYLNPLRPSRVKGQDDRLVEELRRLQDSGNGIVTTTFSKDSIGGVELTDEQVRDLNQAVNTIVRVEWDEAIKDPRYAKLTDEDKNTVLKRIKDNVAKSNKASFVKDHKIPTTTEYKASSSDPFNTTGSSVQISDTISPESKSVLSDYYSMESEDREEWFAEANDNEYKYYKAKYENDKANGEISKIEDVARKRYLAKDKIGADYAKDTRDVYKLSKGDIGTYLSQVDQKTGEKLINELIAYDRKLYDAGLVKYRKFKNGIGSTSSGSSRSSGSSGGTRGNGITIGKQLVALEKQLNALKAPTSSSSSSRPATTPQMRKAALARYSSKTAEDKYGKKKISSRSVRA